MDSTNPPAVNHCFSPTFCIIVFVVLALCSEALKNKKRCEAAEMVNPVILKTDHSGPCCGLGRWSPRTSPGSLEKEIIYNVFLLFPTIDYRYVIPFPFSKSLQTPSACFSPSSLFQSSFPTGGGLSLSSISPYPPFPSLSHLVRQLWLARVQWCWEGVEGRRKEGGGGGGWRWLSFEEAINCKAQGTERKRFEEKKSIVKKECLNQIFSLSLSLSITLSPCALLNSIKKKKAAAGGKGG